MAHAGHCGLGRTEGSRDQASATQGCSRNVDHAGQRGQVAAEVVVQNVALRAIGCRGLPLATGWDLAHQSITSAGFFEERIGGYERSLVASWQCANMLSARRTPVGASISMGAFWMTPTVLPLWLEVIKAVAPLLAALLAAGVGAWVAHKFGRIQESIAKQQAATAAAAATTARNKLRLDLFDRRWAIYQTAKGVIDTMAHQDDDPDSAALKYLSNIRAARWLFDDDVNKYLRIELWDLLHEFRIVRSEIVDAHDQATKKQALQKQHELISELYKQDERINKVFEPYLKLES